MDLRLQLVCHITDTFWQARSRCFWLRLFCEFAAGDVVVLTAVHRPLQDVVTRYAHQTGHNVERRFGWDCHGLPVEYEIDKTLGIKVRLGAFCSPGIAAELRGAC